VLCLGCSTPVMSGLCPGCRQTLAPAPERVLDTGLVIRSGAVHGGVARRLVHVLKYRGVVAAAGILAERMAPLVDAGEALVPVPRVRWRLLRHGVDPAVELATALSRLTGLPTLRLLAAPLWGRPRAGRAHGSAPAYGVRAPSPGVPLVLVDDVVTTGTTLRAAHLLVPGAVAGVTATSAMTSKRAPHRVGAVTPRVVRARDD
jgi:predicted amidophosphoribosyltransferase